MTRHRKRSEDALRAMNFAPVAGAHVIHWFDAEATPCKCAPLVAIGVPVTSVERVGIKHRCLFCGVRWESEYE